MTSRFSLFRLCPLKDFSSQSKAGTVILLKGINEFERNWERASAFQRRIILSGVKYSKQTISSVS